MGVVHYLWRRDQGETRLSHMHKVSQSEHIFFTFLSLFLFLSENFFFPLFLALTIFFSSSAECSLTSFRVWNLCKIIAQYILRADGLGIPVLWLARFFLCGKELGALEDTQTRFLPGWFGSSFEFQICLNICLSSHSRCSLTLSVCVLSKILLRNDILTRKEFRRNIVPLRLIRE